MANLMVVAGLAMPLALGLLAAHYLRVRSPKDWITAPAFLGLAAVVPVKIYENFAWAAIAAAFPSPNPAVSRGSFGELWSYGAFSGDVWRGIVGTAVPEETIIACLLYTWLFASRRRRQASAADLILAGITIMLAFAAFENILFMNGRGPTGHMIVLRSFFATPGHASIGVALGIAAALVVQARTRLEAFTWAVGALVLAVLSHALYDVTLMVIITAGRLGLVSNEIMMVIMMFAFLASCAVALVPAIWCARRFLYSPDLRPVLPIVRKQ